jgi:hypothetical protein
MLWTRGESEHSTDRPIAHHLARARPAFTKYWRGEKEKKERVNRRGERQLQSPLFLYAKSTQQKMEAEMLCV